MTRTALFVIVAGCSGTMSGSDPDAADPGADAGARSDASVGRDAALVDGGARDAGAPVDPSCPPGAVFCESFESAEIDATRWTVHGAEGAIALDAENAADGTRSLRVRMGDAHGFPGAQTIDLNVPIAAPDDRVYARWFMRFTDLRLPGYHPNFVRVVSADFDIGSWWMYEQHSFGSFAGSFSVNHLGPMLDQALLYGGWDAETIDSGDTTPADEHGIAAGAWFCVELMLYGGHDGPDDTEHDDEETMVWLDGMAIEDLHATDDDWSTPEHWSPRYDGSRWTFGIDGAYTNDPGTELWYDAIVFSHERIGCDR